MDAVLIPLNIVVTLHLVSAINIIVIVTTIIIS